MNVLSRNLGIYIHKTSNNSLYRNVFFNKTLTYQSAISLATLYPKSSLKITTLSEPPNVGDSKFNGYIPVDELDITYSRSSGPGGQNVNKVNTKVDVRFHLSSAKWLNDQIKAKLLEKLEGKISKEGYLIYKSDLTRSQQLNLADCLEKIRTSIRESIVEARTHSPETEEKIRRKMEQAARERLIIKRQRSQIKSDRQNLDSI